MVNSAQVVTILDTYTHPNILRPRKPISHLSEPIRTLREDLKGVPTRLLHDSKHLAYEGEGDILVKDTSHRVHENGSPLAPAERYVECLFVDLDMKALAIIDVPHSLESLSHPLRIAVFAYRSSLWSIPSPGSMLLLSI